MRLTAMDIKNKEFRSSLRGYNGEEVDDFLEQVTEDYEAMYKENATLKEKVLTLNEKLEHYAKIESTIQNTLLLAQNAADQAKALAQKEADIIIKNANETAQKIIDKAHLDVMKINEEYEKLKQDFFKFRAKYRNFLKTQLETFEELERDFVKNFNVVTTKEERKIDNAFEAEKTLDVKEIDEEGLNSEELNEIKKFFVKDN
ncbi:MAG: DivIVA domain-containing protein [Clostridiales bacterium]|nr:DivIVA domain-containing protein [Clostridiales bacterium]